MDDLPIRLLIDLHRSNFRQGPGGGAETKKALMLTGLLIAGEEALRAQAFELEQAGKAGDLKARHEPV